MGRILAVDLPAALVERLRVRHLCDVAVASASDLPGAVDEHVLAVVLGAAVPDPLHLVAQLYRRDRHMPVLVLAGGDRFDQVQGEIRLSPLVSRDTRCLPADASLSELAATIVDTTAATERRRSYSKTLARLAEQGLPETLTRSGAAASQYLGQLLDHAPIGVVTIDPAATIRGWNPKATEILGRLPQDAVGSPLTLLFGPDERTSLLEALQDALARDDATTCVLARRGPHGTEQHVELTVAAIDPSVPSLGCLVLVQEVTERVCAQRELAERARTALLAAEVGMVLTSTENLRDKLQRCAEAIVRHLDAAFARIWLAERPTAELVLHASAGMYTHLDGPHGRIPVGAYKIGRIAASRRPHMTNQVLGDPEISDHEWAEREGMMAFAGYPLLLGDDLVGVMALFGRHALSESALQALGAIADTVAVSIEQARARERLAATLEREHAARAEAEVAAHRYQVLAKTLQQSLLPPRLPDVPGLELSARYHWAGDGTTVGGDFYDAFVLPDGRFCAVMGDVSGKGVEAAKLTSLARYTLRAAALSCSSPSELLGTLNAALLQQVTGDEFCTVAVLVLDGSGEAVTMTAASAGHPRPVIVRREGTLEEFGRPGPPAGLFATETFPEEVTRLAPGEGVVLYTDGVIEARSPDGRFHPTLLLDVLARCRGWPAVDIAAAVESSVLAFEDALPRDDLAILAIRVGGAAPPRSVKSRTPASSLEDTMFALRLPAQPPSVPTARTRLAAWIDARPGLAPSRDVVLLVASELVTNAVRAARQEVEVRVWESNGDVAVEVQDDGYGMPAAALERDASDPDDEYGRGLLIVRSLSKSCELDDAREGTVVRCLIPLGEATGSRPA